MVESTEAPTLSEDDQQDINQAVEMIDSRIWIAIEGMPPDLADAFFVELRKCVDDVEGAYWEEVPADQVPNE